MTSGLCVPDPEGPLRQAGRGARGESTLALGDVLTFLPAVSGG